MIITCEGCATRFKVPDDKLAGGAVRVRCSKCNHTFLAGAPDTPPAGAPAPVARAATIDPFAGLAPRHPTALPAAGPLPGAPTSSAASRNPFATAGPALDPFANLGARAPTPAAAAPFAWPAAPSSADPFANVGPVARAPPSMSFAVGSAAAPQRPATPDPFATLAAQAPLGAAHDPFANLGRHGPAGDPFAVPTSSTTRSADAFANPAQNRGGNNPDPFANLGVQPAAMPRSITGTSPDPFANLATGSIPRANTDPFAVPRTSLGAGDPFAHLLAPARTPDPFAPAAAAPSATAIAFGQRTNPEPFANPIARLASPDPFASFGPKPDAMPSASPFGPAGSGSFAVTPSVLAPPAPDDEDRFGSLNHDAGYGDDDRAKLFGIQPPPPRGPTQVPTQVPASSGLELATPAAQPPPSPPETPAARYLPAIQTASWVLQLVLGIALCAAAVALCVPAVPDTSEALAVRDVSLLRRGTKSGTALLIVSGVVHHGGDAPSPAVRVDVSIDGAVVGSGWARSNVNGLDVEALTDAASVSALAERRPPAPKVAPGDDAPFVAVVLAPEGRDLHVVARSVP